LYNSNPIIPI
jgi:hypothetical protein